MEDLTSSGDERPPVLVQRAEAARAVRAVALGAALGVVLALMSRRRSS